ncbi:DUF2167 domain-containing protein [Xanthomonas hyacinthi]|nr:DUF2167 domain-containing protein [Xanthomonas hyacinthi]
MQKETREENTQRKQAGDESVDLVGWAVPPRYAAATKKPCWARELAFWRPGPACSPRSA